MTPTTVNLFRPRNAVLAGLILGVLAGVGFGLVRWLRPAPAASANPGSTPAIIRHPSNVPKVYFTDITRAAGIGFRHFSGATKDKLLPETMGSGVAFIDYDNDGRQDLLFVNACPWPGNAKPDAAHAGPLPQRGQRQVHRRHRSHGAQHHHVWHGRHGGRLRQRRLARRLHQRRRRQPPVPQRGRQALR